NWEFLEKHTNKQTLDFYHATEYLTGVADRVFIDPIKRKAWLNDRCHQLKHTKDAATSILLEMEGFLNDQILDPHISTLVPTNNLIPQEHAVLRNIMSIESVLTMMEDPKQDKQEAVPNKKNREQQ